MELNDAIALIRTERIKKDTATVWADLGCGTGLFTRELSYFLKPGSVIYAVDTNKNALSRMGLPENGIIIEKIKADFVHDPLSLSGLDGILMANSLHFVKDKITFLEKVRNWLRPDGGFLIIEYDTNDGNPWVPYPVSFASLKVLLTGLGYDRFERWHDRPSIYRRAPIYAAFAGPI